MRRSAAFLPFVLALAAMMLAPHGGAQAQGEREEGPIEIGKCQTISQPGSYKLVNNLTFTGPAGGTCLSITVNFVTIDLAGFAISTSISNPNFITTTGIAAADNNGRGITVRNGSISGNGFTAGVSLAGDGSIVEGLRMSDIIGGFGISAAGIVRGNTLVTISGPPLTGRGIIATGVITGNYVSGSRSVGIEAGQGSTVIGNTATNTDGAGIAVTCPSNVTNNTAVNNVINLDLSGTGCNNTNNLAP